MPFIFPLSILKVVFIISENNIGFLQKHEFYHISITFLFKAKHKRYQEVSRFQIFLYLDKLYKSKYKNILINNHQYINISYILKEVV